MVEVKFTVGGVDVAADLYLPADAAAGERRPALVLGNGFGAVKEALRSQGERFAAAGYVALVIDYRSFGNSGGEIRGELFPQVMVEDFRSAITYLETRPEVEPDRIGIWGTSFGGAIVLATAAVDRRVRAVVAQVPIVDAEGWMKWLRTPDKWLDLLDRIEADRRRRFAGEPSARVPLAGLFSSDEFSAMPAEEAIMFFVRLQEATVKTFRPNITMESVEKIIEFNPSATIAKISPRPLLMIGITGHETLHPVEPIMDTFAKALEPKKLALLPYDQLGIYGDPGSGHALRVTLDFLEEYLPVGSAVGGNIPRTQY